MSELTKGERFIFDWQYGREDKNSFKGLLARLLSKADGNNFSKLSKGYPDEAFAMFNFQRTPGWWEAVEDKGRAENPFDVFSNKNRSAQTNIATKKGDV